MSEQILTEEQQERRALALERLKSVPEENILQEPFLEFFRREARFLLYTEDIRETLKKEKTSETDLRVLEDRNQRLYGELLPEHYGSCWDIRIMRQGRQASGWGGFCLFFMRSCAV